MNGRNNEGCCTCRPDGRICDEARVNGCMGCMKGSSSDADLKALMDHLRSEHDSASLVLEARQKYGMMYLARFGMVCTMASYLTEICDDLGLRIDKNDIWRISNAMVERGDRTY